MKRQVLLSTVFISALALAAPTLAAGQHSRGSSSSGGGGSHASSGGGQHSSGGGSRTGTATSRGSGGSTAPAPSSGGSVRAPSSSGGGDRAQRAGSGTSVATPAGGGHGRTDQPSTGTAVPRTNAPGYNGNGRVYVRPYYYPYGAFGLGYWGWYDPFWWDYPYYGPYGGWGPNYGYGYERYRGEYGWLKLEVRPKEAEVYADGYYVGQVRDFDSTFHRLQLEPGPHRIEIRAAGFDSLVFEVKTERGQAITYRGELQPAQPPK